MPAFQSLQQRLRNSTWLAVAEFAVVAGLFYADVHHHIYVSKTPYSFLLGWASLRLRDEVERCRLCTAAQLGKSNPGWSCGRTCDGGVGVVWDAAASGALVGEDAEFVRLRRHGWQFETLPDLPCAGVGTGRLGEEIVYRGYLMNRVAGVFRETKAAWIVSLIVIGVVFGCGHLDQGATGMIENVWNGLLLGALYLGCGRNLAVPIVAHAVTDTLDFALIYLGKYPGLH